MNQTTRGEEFPCRGCLGTNLFLAIDLGYLPISNELPQAPTTREENFPLALYICKDCALGQVQDVVPPHRFFEDYRYLSSVSSTFSKHASDFCLDLISNSTINPGDFILEIAANDGYLLKNFVGGEFKILGVEPAVNVAKKAVELGIPIINEFFGSELAYQILTDHGYPKLIIANNVMAHVPDIRDFIKGLSILANEDTLISIENPSILNILEDNQFDSIYHEHYSYLSCHSVKVLAEQFELSLCDLDRLETHGGSNRYWLQKSGGFRSSMVLEELGRESRAGLNQPDSWKIASEKVRETLEALKLWLVEKQALGEKVLGYGAAAKASTLLNAAGIKKPLLYQICDLSAEKAGRYMPNGNFEIISIEEFLASNPAHVLIFPWNIAYEIYNNISSKLPNAKYWKTIPRLMQIRT